MLSAVIIRMEQMEGRDSELKTTTLNSNSRRNGSGESKQASCASLSFFFMVLFNVVPKLFSAWQHVISPPFVLLSWVPRSHFN